MINIKTIIMIMKMKLKIKYENKYQKYDKNSDVVNDNNK